MFVPIKIQHTAHWVMSRFPSLCSVVDLVWIGKRCEKRMHNRNKKDERVIVMKNVAAEKEKKKRWELRDLNPQPSGLESEALPLRQAPNVPTCGGNQTFVLAHSDKKKKKKTCLRRFVLCGQLLWGVQFVFVLLPNADPLGSFFALNDC